MTIIVRDDFTGTGNIDPLKWADTLTNFYLGQSGPQWLQQSSGTVGPPIDFLGPDAPVYHGKGEATTVPGAAFANQYIEAGMVVDVHQAPTGPIYNYPGKMLIGFRLTGGSGAIEGITVQCITNHGGATNFLLTQTHSGSQTAIGPGSGTDINTGFTFVVRLEVMASTVTLKVNAATIVSSATTVSQLGNGYFYIGNDVIFIESVPEGPPGGLFGTVNAVDYIEYGEFGSDVTTLTNEVAVAGGGSEPATGVDVTTIDPVVSARILFTLDTAGSGNGTLLQAVDRDSFAVESTVTVPASGHAIGGVTDGAGSLYVGIQTDPAKVWKVNGLDLASITTTPITGNTINPYPQLDTMGNAYFVTYTSSPQRLVVTKVRCSDMVVIGTLEIPFFTPANVHGWDGVTIDNGRGYLWVAALSSASGVIGIIKVALGSLTVDSTLYPGPLLTVCNTAFVSGPYLYLGGGTGDIDTVPASANWQLYRYTIDAPSVTVLTGLASSLITCSVFDPASNKAYFGNYEVGTANARLTIVDVASFAVDSTHNFAANTSAIRALTVDDSYMYATMVPLVNGGATWWLGRFDKTTLGNLGFLTAAGWTGTPPVQGAKTLMLTGG